MSLNLSKAGSSKPIFLDIDSSLTEKNLRITGDDDDEFRPFFENLKDDYPSKMVKPRPGLCVKTKTVGLGQKFFLNICHTDKLPAPKDLTAKELEKLLETDDVSEFRVPMSIGEIKTESDKNGDEVKVCDVAINTAFFKKVEEQSTFKNFFFAVVFQAIINKHGVAFQDEKVFLRNKKAFGSLQTHRIQDREIGEKMGIPAPPPSKVFDVEEAKKPMIETISSSDCSNRIPEYRIFRRKNTPNCIYAQFHFPDVISSNTISLDIGEDRILVEEKSRNYFTDLFVPCSMRQKSCEAEFDKTTKILTVTLPLAGG